MNILALCYDETSLNDILVSANDCRDITLILNNVNFPNGLPNNLLKSFKKVIHIENYLVSGCVELAAYQLHKNNPFTHIIATNELDILRAARLRTYFQLKGQDYKSAQAFCDKILMKEILSKSGLKVPAFRKIQYPIDILEFIDSCGLPVVIKPALGTGSEGVKIIREEHDLHRYLKNAENFSTKSSLNLQIESYMAGRMYHINGLFAEGRMVASWPSVYLHQSVCMLEGFSASSYLLSQTNPLVEPLNNYAEKALQALPSPNGTAFHLEVFVDDNKEITFCEIASRVGGKGVRQSWLESFGINLGACMVNAQAGLLDKLCNITMPPKPNILTGEIWFPKQQGVLKSIEKQCPFAWVKDYQVFAKTGDVSTNTKEISECLAGVPLMIAASEPEMQQRLDEISQWFEKNTHWSIC